MKTTAKHLYQHYDSSEHDFLDKVQDMLQYVERSYSIYVTDFIDPRQEAMIEELVAQTTLQCYSSQGIITDEYHRVIIAPDYYQLDVNDFEIVLLTIDYAKKFNKLTHSQIMGTLINQLGIRRTVFGDILVNGDEAQLFLEKSMVTYFETNVAKIAKVPVKLRQIPFERKIRHSEEGEDKVYLVSSLRLDKVIAAVHKLPRQTSQKLIEAQKVKVNYRLMTKTTEEVSQADLISVRGYGRMRIISHEGMTAKGKHRLVVKKIRQK